MTDKQKTNLPDFTCQARPSAHRLSLSRADCALHRADTEAFRYFSVLR
jgi:hypothetical protein